MAGIWIPSDTGSISTQSSDRLWFLLDMRPQLEEGEQLISTTFTPDDPLVMTLENVQIILIDTLGVPAGQGIAFEFLSQQLHEGTQKATLFFEGARTRLHNEIYFRLTDKIRGEGV